MVIRDRNGIEHLVAIHKAELCAFQIVDVNVRADHDDWLAVLAPLNHTSAHQCPYPRTILRAQACLRTPLL